MYDPQAQQQVAQAQNAAQQPRRLNVQFRHPMTGEMITRSFGVSPTNIFMLEHLLYQSFGIPPTQTLVLTLNDSIVVCPVSTIDINEAASAWKCELTTLSLPTGMPAVPTQMMPMGMSPNMYQPQPPPITMYAPQPPQHSQSQHMQQQKTFAPLAGPNAGPMAPYSK